MENSLAELDDKIILFEFANEKDKDQIFYVTMVNPSALSKPTNMGSKCQDNNN